MVKNSVAPGFDRPLPANEDAERFLLGSVLIEGDRFNEISTLSPDEFALTKHRTIYERMRDLDESGEHINRVTLANLLTRTRELEAIDGLSYLSSLEEGMPRLSNLGSYVKIIKDKYRMRQIALIGENLRLRGLEDREDATSIIVSAEDALSALTDTSGQRGDLVSAMEVITGFEGGVNKFLDPSSRSRGISTGFAALDEMTLGLRPGNMSIIAARPSVGKTAFALNIAWHAATRCFVPVVIFSYEMPSDSLLARMICAAARVDSQRFRAGYCNEHERGKLRAAALQAVEAPIYFDDTVCENVNEMKRKISRLEKRLGIKVGLVIVDYLQLMEGKKAENRNQAIGQISRSMKLAAKELDCHWMVLSQLSRAPETRMGDHRPQLADLRESGNIEQDADLVGFLFREEMYSPDREDLRGLAELLIRKQREGPIGKVDLVFLHAQTRFESRAEDLPEFEEG